MEIWILIAVSASFSLGWLVGGMVEVRYEQKLKAEIRQLKAELEEKQ